MHCVDQATRWSEVHRVTRKDLHEQVRIFNLIQINRHGWPQSVTADDEYAKGAFKAFCLTEGIELIITPAHSHQSNGLIERENRILRDYFKKQRAVDKRSPVDDLVQAAAYGRNVNRGAYLASPFEFLYRRAPRLSSSTPPIRSVIPTLTANNEHVIKKRIGLMCRSNIRKHPEAHVGEEFYFWRDNVGWCGPAVVIALSSHEVTVIHNGRHKT